jgi:cytochrome c oxidase subunit 2
MAMSRRAAILGAAAGAFGLSSIGVLVAAESAKPKEKVIKITAKRFAFTPGNITLKKDVPVVFEFRTLDVFMGFNLPDFNVRADIVPDRVARLRLVPDRTGTFVFLCDVFCGGGHEKMSGQLVVVA